jgi:hypothetical protein
VTEIVAIGYSASRTHRYKAGKHVAKALCVIPSAQAGSIVQTFEDNVSHRLGARFIVVSWIAFLVEIAVSFKPVK